MEQSRYGETRPIWKEENGGEDPGMMCVCMVRERDHIIFTNSSFFFFFVLPFRANERLSGRPPFLLFPAFLFFPFFDDRRRVGRTDGVVDDGFSPTR